MEMTFPLESRRVAETRFVEIGIRDLWKAAKAITDNDGRPYGNAILMLSYIMDAHAPVDMVDGGRVVEVRQRFDGPEMRLDYADASIALGGLSKYQIRRALVRLRELGIIGMRHETDARGKDASVFVWPVPSGILALSQAFSPLNTTGKTPAQEVCSQLDTRCSVNYTPSQNPSSEGVQSTARLPLKENKSNQIHRNDDDLALVSKKKKRKGRAGEQDQGNEAKETRYDRAMELAREGLSHVFEFVDDDGFERVYSALRSSWMERRYKTSEIPSDVASGQTPFDVVPNEGTQKSILRPWIDRLVGMCEGDVEVACDVASKCVQGKPTRNISYVLGRYFCEKGDSDELRQLVDDALKRSHGDGAQTPSVGGDAEFMAFLSRLPDAPVNVRIAARGSDISGSGW